MKTTIELPDELIKDIKFLAIEEGKKFKDVVADLLRQGLNSITVGASMMTKADDALLKRRKSLTQKFVAGEWGFDLTGFEAARKAERRSSSKRAKAWRD